MCSGNVYWADSLLKAILRASLSGSDAETVISTGLDAPDGLVVDPVGRVMYWTDAGTKRVEVASLDGLARKVLAWRGVDKPRAIALHYKSGSVVEGNPSL